MTEKSRKAVALIAAAGRGERMGAATRKQYLDLAGRPILAHTIAVFQQSPEVDAVVPVVAPEDVEYCWEKMVYPYGFSKVIRVVAGGVDRSQSVWLGLQALDPHTELVLVHDGVRPLVPPDQVAEVIGAARLYGAAVLAVPVKDTIKEADAGGFVARTPDRGQLWASQTPQVFAYELLLRAYRQALEQEGTGGTDDAMLVEALGCPVKLVPGAYRNIKITTEEDLTVARVLLEGGER